MGQSTGVITTACISSILMATCWRLWRIGRVKTNPPGFENSGMGRKYAQVAHQDLSRGGGNLAVGIPVARFARDLCHARDGETQPGNQSCGLAARWAAPRPLW